MTFIPKHEGITGSDLSGVDGTTSRTFQLNNEDAISAQMIIVIENASLQIGIDFTFDTDNNTVTFINNVWDDQNISLDYFIDDSAPPVSSTMYCNTLQVARFSGIGVEIQLEQLGIGDNSNKSFDTEHGNIIEDSYTLYFGATDSNDLTSMVKDTDYLIFLDDGRILLTTAGLAKLDDNILYYTYTYSPKQSDTVLSSYSPAAIEEVDKLTSNYWGPEKSNIEYFDGYTSGYPQTDRPFGEQIDNQPEFELKYKSIQSVTAIEFLDFTGTVHGNVDTNYIRFDEDGRVLTGPSTIPNGKRNVKISFTHGYDEVPAQIQELCALITGLMAFVNISGGSYKDVSTYTLGRKTFSIGQVYVNIRESIDQMKSRIESILDDVGYRYAVA